MPRRTLVFRGKHRRSFLWYCMPAVTLKQQIRDFTAFLNNNCRKDHYNVEMSAAKQLPNDDVSVTAGRLLLGREILGVYFGGELSVIFSDGNKDQYPDSEDCKPHLVMSCPWALESNTTATADDPHEFNIKQNAEKLQVLSDLAEIQITSVNIGRSSRNLQIGFENGQTLIASGDNGGYECWQIGIQNPYFSIIAIEGDIITCGSLEVQD